MLTLYLSIFFGTATVIFALLWFISLQKAKKVSLDLVAMQSQQSDANELIAKYSGQIDKQSGIIEQHKTAIASLKEQIEKHKNQLEDIIVERTRALVEAKEKAEGNDKLKSAFLENMSHEIRTPMNAILGFINLLDNPSLDESTREYYLNYINQSSKTLLRLVDDIIDFLRLEAGEIFIDRRQCKINDIVNEVASAYRKKIVVEKPKLTLQLEGLKDELVTYTDTNRLKQILNQLMDNALKFTESGQVKLQVVLNNETVDFSISDSGIGIEEKFLNRIFNRFFKIETEYSKNLKGAGLGLSICKQLVELLEGNITVTSKLGEGSTFTLSIPYQPREIISTNTQVRKKTFYSWSNKEILIAEDEDTNYHFLEAVLSKTGATLTRAENGVELLELFNTPKRYDIILLDIKMPGLDGLKALKLIRQISEKIPILAQTAYNSPSDRKKCLDMGCDDFIAKPIPQHLLLDKMNKLFEKTTDD